MRALVVIASVLVAACGGSATPPPEAPAGDTSSLENGSGSKDSKEKEDAPAASASAEPAATPAPSTPAPAASAAADDSAPPAAFHPAPSVTGAIDGKPFAPKVAQVLGAMKKDGRILITLTEASECPAAGEKGDHTALTMLVPWSDGYKVDLSSLKLGNKKGPAEIAFSRSKKDVSTTFKPSGMVTVVSAPTEKGKTGKLKVDMQSGDFMLAGTLDVEMCAAAK
jgi:hypothetical protein